VSERPRLWLLLSALNVLFSSLLVAPLSVALAAHLDLRPAATPMVAGDDGLWFELLTDHPELVSLAVGALGAGALVWGVFSWIFAGGVLGALAVDGERRALGAAQVLEVTARSAPRMLVLGALGLPLRIVPLGIGVGAFMALRSVLKAQTFGPLSVVAMAALVLFAVLWTAISIAIDYARGLSLDDTKAKSVVLVWRGIKLALTRRSATLQLVAFSIAAWLAVGVVYYWLADHVSALLILTMVRMLSVVARTAITLTTLLAAARVAYA
jgi:hypothetical protein